jgi:hypothetical protein
MPPPTGLYRQPLLPLPADTHKERRDEKGDEDKEEEEEEGMAVATVGCRYGREVDEERRQGAGHEGGGFVGVELGGQVVVGAQLACRPLPVALLDAQHLEHEPLRLPVPCGGVTTRKRERERREEAEKCLQTNRRVCGVGQKKGGTQVRSSWGWKVEGGRVILAVLLLPILQHFSLPS